MLLKWQKIHSVIAQTRPTLVERLAAMQRQDREMITTQGSSSVEHVQMSPEHR